MSRLIWIHAVCKGLIVSSVSQKEFKDMEKKQHTGFMLIKIK